VKVVFGIDREDAEVMAKKIFFVDTQQVKHDAASVAQIPLYDPLPEQWEKATASIQQLRPRLAYVKERGVDPVLIRTETIKPYRVSQTIVEELTRELARVHGTPPNSLQRPIVSPRLREPVQLFD
jgi:hypothetical protein